MVVVLLRLRLRLLLEDEVAYDDNDDGCDDDDDDDRVFFSVSDLSDLMSHKYLLLWSSGHGCHAGNFLVQADNLPE